MLLSCWLVLWASDISGLFHEVKDAAGLFSPMGRVRWPCNSFLHCALIKVTKCR